MRTKRLLFLFFVASFTALIFSSYLFAHGAATHYHFVLALGFNTQHINPAEAPKSYEELLHPKWKGRFSLDPADQDLFGALLFHWGQGARLF